ncbi:MULTISPECIES: hypothetical protein [unclassified Coleofasciculus]|uniref:hypothetical protein n=1 Tax=unclassified Coleofasciculus TaxID=2692782 RepID=UPI00187E4281|nr:MULTISPECIES: hypothetical protein [unclassified Coleofasciculus]MBE9129380.1 hypothetical protein [Coleofasciculus sp. LEGE 07081]MBE9152014.1 hypothetical protein [Coleofasciculus sp. LEGE 07092]
MPGKYDNAFPNAQKVQIFEQVETYIETQNNTTNQQTFEILLADFQDFLTHRQTQHPAVTSPEAATQTITVQAKQLPPAHWQNFLTLKRLWNGSKQAGIKVGEHFVESNPWGKGAVAFACAVARIAFLEGVSEDVK